MFTLAPTSVSVGIRAESMLWIWRIWWKRMPSTKPPMPIPITVPATVIDLVADVLTGMAVLLKALRGGPAGPRPPVREEA